MITYVLGEKQKQVLDPCSLCILVFVVESLDKQLTIHRMCPDGPHWSLPPECVSPPPFTQSIPSAKGPPAEAGIWECCTQNSPTVCFLLLSPCHIFFSPRRKHLLLWLWHLKSNLRIVGDCLCVGGFPGCAVNLKKKCFFKEKHSQPLEHCLVSSKWLCNHVPKYLRILSYRWDSVEDILS